MALTPGLQLPFGIQPVNAVPAVTTYGPYATIVEAKTSVLLAIRHDGLTVKINGLGEYWWLAADLTDSGLIPKTVDLTGYGNTTVKEFYITGNSSSTSFTFTHNLNNRKLKINVSKDFNDYEEIDPRRFTTTLNTATVVFQVAPTTGQNYNVIVIGIDKSSGIIPPPTGSGFSNGFSNGFN